MHQSEGLYLPNVAEPGIFRPHLKVWCSVLTVRVTARQFIMKGRSVMTSQEQIKKDLIDAIKARDAERKEALRVVLGEFDRQEDKELTDDEAVGVLRRLVKSERETLELKGETDSSFIRIIEEYLPRMATDEEIADFIKENIDFSQFKNRMQAMGPIMKHFGKTADGNAVKRVLQSI